MAYQYMDICRMDFADPAHVTRLTRSAGSGGEEGDWDEHAHLSKFGDAFVWMSSRGTGWDGTIATLKTDFWLMNADGSGASRLTWFNDPAHSDYFGSDAVASDVDWAASGRALIAYVRPAASTVWTSSPSSLPARS